MAGTRSKRVVRIAILVLLIIALGEVGVIVWGIVIGKSPSEWLSSFVIGLLLVVVALLLSNTLRLEEANERLRK
ncbi:hypothetical protein GCM10010149_88070 [Nonomuraea roseoviolacea subsp. roseoviolacea]|uniref:hypothetical protein n=1 Tax=Nonomuraea roseoviolacea TaxID=103837 RepID=UPI0031DAE12B